MLKLREMTEKEWEELWPKARYFDDGYNPFTVGTANFIMVVDRTTIHVHLYDGVKLPIVAVLEFVEPTSKKVLFKIANLILRDLEKADPKGLTAVQDVLFDTWGMNELKCLGCSPQKDF